MCYLNVCIDEKRRAVLRSSLFQLNLSKIEKKNKKTIRFYVAYLKNADECIVVPDHWLRDSQSTMLVKIINKGLNKNQLHLVFWSIDEIHVAPNFDLDVAFAYPPLQNEACYLCYILKCFREFLSRNN